MRIMFILYGQTDLETMLVASDIAEKIIFVVPRKFSNYFDMQIPKLKAGTKLVYVDSIFSLFSSVPALVKIYKPDIFISSCPISGFVSACASKLTHKRMVLIMCQDFLRYFSFRKMNPIKKYAIYVLLHKFLRTACKADRVSVLSTYLSGRAKAYGAKDVTIIPVFGVDTKIFKMDKTIRKKYRQKWGFGNSPVIYAPIRYSPEKGIEVLLDAFVKLRHNLPDAKLLLAGYGPDEQKTREQIKLLGLSKSVFLMDFLKRNDTVRYYNIADVCVMPSLEEGLGFAAAEALACEIPVVSTSAGGLPDIAINNKTGLVVRPGDADALANALICSLNDKTKVRKLAKAGRLHVKQVYEREKVMGKMKKFLLETYRGEKY